jgi:hypothetical protein
MPWQDQPGVLLAALVMVLQAIQAERLDKVIQAAEATPIPVAAVAEREPVGPIQYRTVPAERGEMELRLLFQVLLLPTLEGAAVVQEHSLAQQEVLVAAAPALLVAMALQELMGEQTLVAAVVAAPAQAVLMVEQAVLA